MASSVHEFHKNAIAAHEAAADQHDALSQECEKAITSDLSKLVPTQVTAINPNPEVRSIPRVGQREVPERPNVPPQFAKLVSVENTQYDK